MDISSIEGVRRLVDTFYGKDRMVRFWQTVLLEEHTYFGSPFVPHANMPLEARHFDVWLGLWDATVDELFEGTKATEAKWRAAKMAEMFVSRIFKLI